MTKTGKRINFDVFQPRTADAMACMLTYSHKCDYCIRESCEYAMPDGSDCYEGIKAFLEKEVKEGAVSFDKIQTD